MASWILKRILIPLAILMVALLIVQLKFPTIHVFDAMVSVFKGIGQAIQGLLSGHVSVK